MRLFIFLKFFHFSTIITNLISEKWYLIFISVVISELNILLYL